jgi:hypothetical protein
VTTVAECSTTEEALLMKSLLESFGVVSFLPDELTVTFRGNLASVRLQVADEDAKSARAILANRAT